jgi:hypothetical protein
MASLRSSIFNLPEFASDRASRRVQHAEQVAGRFRYTFDAEQEATA